MSPPSAVGFGYFEGRPDGWNEDWRQAQAWRRDTITAMTHQGYPIHNPPAEHDLIPAPERERRRVQAAAWYARQRQRITGGIA